MFKYFLASKSPRRKDLMTQIGIEFQVMISERDEIITSTVPEEVVKEFFENQVEFNYVPYSALDKCRVEDGKLIGILSDGDIIKAIKNEF